MVSLTAEADSRVPSSGTRIREITGGRAAADAGGTTIMGLADRLAMRHDLPDAAVSRMTTPSTASGCSSSSSTAVACWLSGRGGSNRDTAICRTAATAWAKHGGVGTGNHNIKASVYPDAITRATQAPNQTAKPVVFDMSDLQPASFGSTTGQGEWGIFQKFLKNPKNVMQIAHQLEAAATAAYKKGK